MRTKPGRRDDVIKLLLRDQSALRDIGCHSYLVGGNDEEPGDDRLVRPALDGPCPHRDQQRRPARTVEAPADHVGARPPVRTHTASFTGVVRLRPPGPG
jgi:hypothetical protein